MATYVYRCDTDGPVDVPLPMGTAPSSLPCPRCAREAVRLFCPPRVSTGSRRIVEAIDRAERSRDAPEVVTRVPGAGARRPPVATATNPLTRRLPRP
ncbi:hypothetical protein I601_2947 [Nocardioides dokdonensis FR1436]|uniref:Zinc ribbon domain protein n=1 Tax=Nocardioides dokdonensis FR1436 TaxID=1300347 RepID=A0A1A9GM48_9ACTN|nr:hypothetical protein I601_2947 [Nocardioides dokdonensis FR1436]